MPKNPHRIVDEIVTEVAGALKDAERNVRREWKWTREDWERSRTAGDLRNVKRRLDDVPGRLSDLATDGSCLVRYLSAYSAKGISLMMAFAGLIAAGHGAAATPMELESLVVGLALLASGQLGFWGGHLLHKSADRRRDAKDQNRLLRLARKRGGSLTVLEAAADLRLTVDKTEDMLRDLAARGHAEVRVSESGLLVYHFAEIEFASEKDTARPVDDL